MNAEKQNLIIDNHKYLFELMNNHTRPFTFKEKFSWYFYLVKSKIKYYLDVKRWIRDYKFVKKCKKEGKRYMLSKPRRWCKPYRSIYPISFGFECGDGWFDLINNLITKIDELDVNNEVRIFQIKEKFGGLRVYIDGPGTDEIYDLIEKAENESYKICEKCGNPGKPNKKGWISTLCDECRG